MLIVLEMIMAPESASRTLAYFLLGILGAVLFVAVARATDQRRMVGYDPAESLVAACGARAPTFFTDRDRLAVYVESAQGRVAGQPVHRSGEVLALECRRAEGVVAIVTDRGEIRLRLVGVTPQALALVP